MLLKHEALLALIKNKKISKKRALKFFWKSL